MIERLQSIKEKFDALTNDLMNPDILADMSVWQKKSKEQSSLAPIVEKYDEYVKIETDMKDAEELLKSETDPDMVAMLNEEYYAGKDKLKVIEEELKILLLPKDENDEGNVIVEIRAGVGGDEAAIFAVRDNSDVITSIHFDKALERVIAGLESKNSTLIEKEKKTDTRQRAPKIKFTYQEAKEYETIEADIETLETKISQCDNDMAANSTDFVKLNEIGKIKEELELRLVEKMERWEYLMEKAEQIAQQK